jgi:glycosyltransferase involved in cell wall biosynthesis
MAEPLVSVIIPAYKQAEYLGDAIASALNQTYTHLEVIVVNDASPDATDEVVASFADPRLRYLVHDRNRMLAAARNTGMAAARGEIFALLDADDYFDPRKIAEHVTFLQQHPEYGVSYNARFELLCRSKQIRNIVYPPATVTLADLVLGFPFTPSDMVLRREWAARVENFDESFVHFSEDMDINCRLALAGCRFGGVGRALNFRRHHAGRIIRNTRQRLEAALRSLGQTFGDVRTPPEVRVLADRAVATNYIVWAVEALRQSDTATGVEFAGEASRRLPSIMERHPNELSSFILYSSIYDEEEDHAQVIRMVEEQLPDSYRETVKAHADADIARGWLIKAQRLLIWSSEQAGHACLAEASRRGAIVDAAYVHETVHQLLGCAQELGQQAAEGAARRLDSAFGALYGRSRIPSFAGALALAGAFANYYAGHYEAVPPAVLRAVSADPRHVLNRGALSIMLRSTMQARFGSKTGRSQTSKPETP